MANVHTNLYKCDISFFLSFFLLYRQLHVTVLPFKTLLLFIVLLLMVLLRGLFFFRLTPNVESDHILSLINISPSEDYKNVLWRHLVSL